MHALAPDWRYTGHVASIQVKNVPDDVRAVWRRRAAAAGQSLQEYLLNKLTEEARRPTLDEVLARAAERTGGSFSVQDAVEIIRRDRDTR